MGGGGQQPDVVTYHTYYYYKVKVAHHSIDPSQAIYCYDAYGTTLYIIPPYDPNMDYTSGIYSVPGNQPNALIESVSTASYYVYYSSDDLIIDYDNAEFKIAKKLLPDPTTAIVHGTFEFLAISTPLKDIASVIDGRWDTQVQTIFYSEPPRGYKYAILDLGAIYDIQALDIVAGFFKPDSFRKYDIQFYVSLEYSLDGSNWYVISNDTYNFSMSGGEGKSFEEDKLGIGFRTRYIRLVLERVNKIDFGTGTWAIALTEIAAYSNIVIKSTSSLISTTQLTQNVVLGNTIVNVVSTDGFSEPVSAESVTAYINGLPFTYTDLTSTSFIGCVLEGSTVGVIGDRVSQTLESDTTIYDDSGLKSKLGDRLYKKIEVSDDILYTQAQLDYLTNRWQREFIKNHNKISIDVLYAPHLQIGQTIKLVDPYNGTNENYFICEIKDSNGFYNITVAKYQ